MYTSSLKTDVVPCTPFSFLLTERRKNIINQGVHKRHKRMIHIDSISVRTHTFLASVRMNHYSSFHKELTNALC